MARGEHFYLVRDYEEIAANFDRVKMDYKSSVDAQAIRMINALIAESIALPYQIKNLNEGSRYNITADCIPLLFFLSSRPDGVVGYKEICLHFGYGTSIAFIRRKLDYMTSNGYVQKITDGHYQLTGLGVHLTTILRERILNRSG
jgi:hypothetical protein